MTADNVTVREDLLFYKLRDLILEQSEGEWTDAQIVADAHHFAHHLRPMLAAAPSVPSPVDQGSFAGAHTQPGAADGVSQWQPIETAPRDGTPIVGWCVHDADPYFIEPDEKGRTRLTLYGGHTEGLSHVSDGPHVLVWGGAWDDRTHEYDGGSMPDWWFRSDSEFEVTANPVLWLPLPPAEVKAETGR